VIQIAVADKMAPPLEDIENCNLAQVSWVTPDGLYSDHPGAGSSFVGPAWVAAIVNAIGTANTCDAGKGYWSDTLILVTWDDWGGWYDHVKPPLGYPDLSGGQYVYGFRVPLLVVSAYNKHTTNGQQGFTGYISGACQSPGNCQNQRPPFIHDFGSILNFVEYAFGQIGEVYPAYHYADWLARDGPNNPTVCSRLLCPYGLSDFFYFGQTPTTFQTIVLPPVLNGYNAEYFENLGTHPGDPPPQDPDDDLIDYQN
jgi:hypothetical protein